MWWTVAWIVGCAPVDSDTSVESPPVVVPEDALAGERDCDGLDDDADGYVDEGLYLDSDADGFAAGEPCVPGRTVSRRLGDCDDHNDQIGPDAMEKCDAVDNDCDAAIDEALFLDGDGDFVAGDEPCIPGKHANTERGDCDDADSTVHPGADEVSDDKDNDCDGEIDELP